MGELWKQCADWLCRLEVLPPNHRITWPDAEIQDLAYTLRDGVLLCHIATTIDPHSIDMNRVNQRPQLAQFLCLKNIRRFLDACTTHFGVKETDLFQPAMLYDYTDFARVLHTLSKLSNCAKAKERGIEGFPKNAKAPSEDEEQIYRTLEELVNEDNYEDFYYRHHGGNGIYGGRSSRQYYTNMEKEENIYEDLCSFKNSSSRRMQRELNIQPKEKRDYCIKELVETEGNYVEVLNMLQKHFIRPISTIKESDKSVIFMNLKDLGEIHAAFYQEILESVLGKTPKKLGEIFLDFKSKFLVYGEFCCQLPKAMEHLDHLITTKDAIRDEVGKCELAANEGRFKLRDLLAVPMQRILKYPLLLQQLVTHTNSSHEEYLGIQYAYESMVDVSEYINEVKRDAEQLLIIKDIQNSITDWDMPQGTELKDYGRLRKDSELRIQSHDTNGKTKNRYVFLFDKVILMCKATRGDHYSFKHSEKLQDFKVQDVPVRTLRLGREPRWGHSFILVHAQNKTAFTMFAKTQEDKAKWMGAIKEALDNVFPSQRPSSSHDPYMFSFSQATSCDYCHKLLKGLFHQGYRCDKCMRPMHKQCISLIAKCGTQLPPDRPERRPPSMLPTSTGDNRLSSISIDESLATMSLFQRQKSSRGSLNSISLSPAYFHDYINIKVEDHTWYVGDIDRNKAEDMLEDYPVGTFLVRDRHQNGERLGYAISLKTAENVMHMKTISGPGGDVSLSDLRKFDSVVSLVMHYSRHSLEECFKGLDYKLSFSIGEVFIVEVQFDFTPRPNEKNVLSLKSGDKIAIIDKGEEENGWWKAFTGNRVGFIPKDFVKPVRNGENARATLDTQESQGTTNQSAKNDVNGIAGQDANENVQVL